METQIHTFKVSVKFSNELGTLSGCIQETIYEDILLADSNKACLEDLVKKIDEIIAQREQRLIRASILEIKIYKLSKISNEEIISEILFFWKEGNKFQPNIDSYNIIRFFEDFIKRNNLS